MPSSSTNRFSATKPCTWALVGLALCGVVHAAVQEAPSAGPEQLTVVTWNIWHGGREDGEELGPARGADVLRTSAADLVALQETYGSGERLAAELGFTLHPRGTNVSILSRFPIREDLSVGDDFQCVGALVELPDATLVAFYSLWLPYSAEIWEPGTRDTSQPGALLAACEASARALQTTWNAIDARLSHPRYADVPILIAGDFNSMSHLDYGEIGFDQYGAVVDWPTSHVLARAGFRDSYRECNPVIDRTRDSTWTPRFPEQEQDRIDFVHYRAARWRARESRVVRSHPDGFPSDHAVVRTVFQRVAAPEDDARALRAVSYNIRHGEGMDGAIDLARTADVLRALRPDVVGLQEVDLRATRSAGQNQALELAEHLGLHPAFGSFMDFQGGRYGMAVLSRHPIVDVRSLRLPDGNEPRVALLVEVRLPAGDTVVLVNVHFDWVADDAFRFAQASTLAAHLATLQRPYVLLGDFNDLPASRTLELFRPLATEATKPRDARWTFPSTAPEREIDFLFCAPPAAWSVADVRVMAERVASDHRPVFADLRLRAE